MLLPISANEIEAFTVVPPNTPTSSDAKKKANSTSSLLLTGAAAFTPARPSDWRSNAFDFQQSLLQLRRSNRQRRHPKSANSRNSASRSRVTSASMAKEHYEQWKWEHQREQQQQQRHINNHEEIFNEMNPTVFSVGTLTYYDSQQSSTAKDEAKFEKIRDEMQNAQSQNVNNNNNRGMPRKFYNIGRRAHGDSAERLSDSISMGIITVVEPHDGPSHHTRPPLQWGGSSGGGVGVSMAAGAASATTHAAAGLAVFMFSLTAVIFLFLLFYLISRFFRHSMAMSHAAAGGRFDGTTRSSIIDDDFSSASQLSARKFNLLARHFANEPNSILYPKRIYELQAEEGCLNTPLGFPIAAGLAAVSQPSYLLNASGYAEQNCWMNTVLLTGEGDHEHANGNGVQKKKSTVSIASLSKPELIKDLAKNAKTCGRNIARKLTGIESPLSKEKLQRIHQLRNEEFSCA